MNENKTNINWYPGHMAKTKREISEILPKIDLIYEIIDARIPYSSKIKDIDDLIKNKRKILIMSKSDLCDSNETNKWVKYYENLNYKVLLVNLNNKSDINKIIQLTNNIKNDINKKREEKGLKNINLKALVIGIPNVGKSTFINALAGKKIAITGNKPGVTKNLNWLNTKYNVSILDTPGILWPKFESNEVALNLASMSAIKSEIVNDNELCIHILNKYDKYYKDILKNKYNIDVLDTDTYEEAYNSIGNKYGYKISGGEVDYKRVALKVINDLKNENIKGITFDRYYK